MEIWSYIFYIFTSIIIFYWKIKFKLGAEENINKIYSTLKKEFSGFNYWSCRLIPSLLSALSCKSLPVSWDPDQPYLLLICLIQCISVQSLWDLLSLQCQFPHTNKHFLQTFQTHTLTLSHFHLFPSINPLMDSHGKIHEAIMLMQFCGQICDLINQLVQWDVQLDQYVLSMSTSNRKIRGAEGPWGDLRFHWNRDDQFYTIQDDNTFSPPSQFSPWHLPVNLAWDHRGNLASDLGQAVLRGIRGIHWVPFQ